ncbi:hypothetical protein HNP37_001973 [Flavobacterium nitrogenifigens]|uniref:DUF4251 domain-containing protein n=2 Tax=Flavobacterium TaxID=237 RepID=A0A7W7IXG6_9FLAO|nr:MULTISPECIES: DUF4251 domain-containing protein [Flavobacterium]MBB4801912.1 hypothetical protein [Flavobacterium nitrogenifigens]MBB6386870.1 hypothetical protein [Flavobacterium notoginsengisoli]
MSAKLSVLLLVCFLSFPALAQQKTKKELKAEEAQKKQKEIEELIDAKTFVFEAQKVTPQGGRLIILNDYSYFLKFNSDTVSCDLPFFGRAFNVGYNGDGGIKFEGKPENIKVGKKSKNINFQTTVKGQNDTYDLMFRIFYNGTATLSVNSNNRAPISYDGIIRAPEEKEKKAE